MLQRRKRVESNDGFLPQTHKRVERGKKSSLSWACCILGWLKGAGCSVQWGSRGVKDGAKVPRSSCGTASAGGWLVSLPEVIQQPLLLPPTAPLSFSRLKQEQIFCCPLGWSWNSLGWLEDPWWPAFCPPSRLFKLPLVIQAFWSSSYCPLVVTWVKTDVPFLYFNCCLPFKSLIKRGCCLWEVSVVRGVHIFPGTMLPNVILYGCCWSLRDAGDRIQVLMHSRIVVYH